MYSRYAEPHSVATLENAGYSCNSAARPNSEMVEKNTPTVQIPRVAPMPVDTEPREENRLTIMKLGPGLITARM